MRATAMRVTGVLALAGALAASGCVYGPSPSYTAAINRPKEVVDVQRGEIIAVNDVMIEPTNARRIVATSSESKGPKTPPPAPPPRRSGLSIPIAKPLLIAGEEITVRLNDGKLMMIVQERSSPAMAKGERVRVVTEVLEGGLGAPLTRVEREQ